MVVIFNKTAPNHRLLLCHKQPIQYWNVTQGKVERLLKVIMVLAWPPSSAAETELISESFFDRMGSVEKKDTK